MSFDFASAGGDGFDWNPEGVTFGIDLQTDRIFDGSTITDDYSAVFGGDFDPDAISALGMAAFDGGTNYPDAAGDLLAKLQTLDYTAVFFWRQQQVFNGSYLAALRDAGNQVVVEIGAYSGGVIASDANGDFNEVGQVRGFSDNVLAVSFNEDGLLASLNGETAVLSEPQPTTPIAAVNIAHESATELEGWLKALIFYPATNAAGVEAYSANAAPANTVAPVITGTAQVGQVLSVSTGTWTGTPTSYEYQWYNGTFSEPFKIVGATANTFTPTEAEFGNQMKCVVYALNADGIGGIGVSDDETVQTNKPFVTGVPVVSGTPEVDELLTTTNGTWGNDPDSFAYQWYNDNGVIVGATASTYTVQAGDVGLTVGCGITATNEFGSSAETYSNFLGPVT